MTLFGSWFLGGASVTVLLLWLLLITITFCFEIVMFLDVIKNKKLSDTEKLLWGIGMLLFHPVIAIVYYFVAYSQRKNK